MGFAQLHDAIPFLIYSQLAQRRCDNVTTSLLMLSQRCSTVENQSCADVSFRRCQDVATTFSSIEFLGHFTTDYPDFFSFIEM